ncbi:hypothetical protein Tco_1305997 [Tanacetum coccineum]
MNFEPAYPVELEAAYPMHVEAVYPVELEAAYQVHVEPASPVSLLFKSFEFIHQNGVIGIDVDSTGGNNGFWFGADLGIIREIEFQNDFVLEDFESFVRSIVEEDSSGVENSLYRIV